MGEAGCDDTYCEPTGSILGTTLLARRSTRKHWPISPINQLPREILAEIFWNCMPEIILGRRVRMSKSAAPLLVCSICSSWRNLALAMPELWTAVGIIIYRLYMDSLDFIRIINAWLKRSGSLPLTLHLEIDSVLYRYVELRPSPRYFKSILSVLYSHASRWQDVTLSLFDAPSSPLPRLNTPLLRSFRLFGIMKEPIPFPFRECRRLTRLDWPFPLDASEDRQIPWSQISYLHISGLTPFSVLEMIRLCPQLEEFSVDCSGFSEDPDPPRETKVENHRLRILSLDVYEKPGFLFHSITLPALQEFAYVSKYVDDDVPSTQRLLLDFLTHSKCKLKKLELVGCEFTTPELLECLEHEAFETIQKLSVVDSPVFTDDVLVRLTDFPSPAMPHILLPKLRHLTLWMCLEASPGKLGDLVSSRYY